MKIKLIQKKNFFFLVLLLSTLMDVIYAQNVVVWTNDTNHILLGKHISIFEDKTKSLKLSDVISGDLSDQFVVCEKEVPSYGVTESAFWVLFLGM